MVIRNNKSKIPLILLYVNLNKDRRLWGSKPEKLWGKRMKEDSRYWIYANYNDIYFEMLHTETYFCVSTKKIKINLIICILSINITFRIKYREYFVQSIKLINVYLTQKTMLNVYTFRYI